LACGKNHFPILETYLTLHPEIYPSGSKQVRLTCYSDAEWAGDESRKSGGGFVISAFGGPIAWKCKQIRTICLSVLESEITYLSRCCRELVWLRRLCNSMDLLLEEPIIVYGDNEGSLEAAKSARISDKTKHIAVAELFVRQAVAEGWVVLVHVPGTENPADIFTKPLGPILFLRCVLILMCTALRKQ
jgi:hypothetical protein